MFLPKNLEHHTTYHPMFVTASHSLLLDVASSLNAFSLLLPIPIDSARSAP